MSRKLVTFILVVTAVAVVVACGSAEETVSTATLTSVPEGASRLVALEIFPQDSATDEGATRQFNATSILEDGTRSDVTSQASWSSSDESVLIVGEIGLVRAVSSGKANMKASADGIISDAVTLAALFPFVTEDGVKLRGRLFG